MDALRRSVRAFAGPLGYDCFILYAGPLSGDGIVEQLLWMVGNWLDEGSEFDPETYLARCPVNRHVLWTKRASRITTLIESSAGRADKASMNYRCRCSAVPG